MSFVVRLEEDGVSAVVGPWEDKAEAIAWYHGVNEAFRDDAVITVYSIDEPFTLEQIHQAQNLGAAAGLTGGLLAEPVVTAPSGGNVINGHRYEDPRTVAAGVKFLRLLSDSEFDVMDDFHPGVDGSLTLVDAETRSAVTLLVFEASDDADD